MRIIPVLDVLAGQVVRGIAGRRSEYRPIVSRLTTSTRPIDVAEAFRAHFGFRELYLADLDAIGGMPPALTLYAELQTQDFHLWIDAGVRDRDRAVLLADAGVAGIVVGLETVAGPESLADICQQFGDRIIFSLDLIAGRPLGKLSGWKTPDAWEIATQAVECGVRRLIVLDLQRVGMAGGTGTEDLCRRMAEAYPSLEIVAGGGVRNQDDLDRLAHNGVQAVLAASALHDGTLVPKF